MIKLRKGDSWEGGHRMPFIVRRPGKTPAGSVSEQTIAFPDVFAKTWRSSTTGFRMNPGGRNAC